MEITLKKILLGFEKKYHKNKLEVILLIIFFILSNDFNIIINHKLLLAKNKFLFNNYEF